MAPGSSRGALRQLQLTSRLAQRFKIIHALWLTVYTLPKDNIQPLYEEFFFAVGQIFEGVKPEEVNLQKIPKQSFLDEVTRP